jgi:N-methylhydantoinase B/oxoprolinase/acetone carboxylase alpha subunit
MIEEKDIRLEKQKLLDRFDNVDKLPAAVQPEQSIVLPESVERDIREIEEDSNYTKEKLKAFVKQSEKVLEHASDIATETGEARAIEAFATLLKHAGELAKAVTDTTTTKLKTKKEITSNQIEKNIPNSVVQNNNANNYFVGSTKELLDALNANSIIDVTPEKTSDTP